MISFGDAVDLDVLQVDVVPEREYPVVGVLNRGRGLLFRDPVTSAATRYRKLNQVRPNQLVYSRLKAFEGSITVAPPTLGLAFASQEFPTFTCRNGVVPAFLRLLTERPHLWDELAKVSKGMGGRRERVRPEDLLALPLLLPPEDAQRRIVDLIETLDEALEATTSLCGTLDRALSVQCRVFTEPEGPPAGLLPDFTDNLDRRRVPVNSTDRADRTGDVPYYGACGPVGTIDEAIFDEELVLLWEDGGPVAEFETRPQAYKIQGPSWVNNHAHVLRATGVPAGWLYYSLRHRDLRPFSSVGTRAKITQAQMNKIPIWVPAEMDEQLAQLRATDEARREADAAAERLSTLRSHLLTVLLSGDHEIPASYDELLEVASA